MEKLRVPVRAAVPILLIVILAISYFSPWLSHEKALHIIEHKEEKLSSSRSEGCYTSCTDCGEMTSKKAPFGRSVELKYICDGLLPEEARANIEVQTKKVFVSFVGTVNLSFLYQ